MSDKKALCVGINEFRNYPDNRLNGCVNDAHTMANIFCSHMGFADEDITTLLDDEATKANIMGRLQAMVDGAKAGKYRQLAFSLSSHGTQVPDVHGDEGDPWDEAFCPHDLDAKGDVWDPDHIILDDELHDLFAQVPESTRIDVYLDTCHSGTGLKAMAMMPGRKARYIPPPSLGPFKAPEEIKSRSKGLRRYGKSPASSTLWAACRSNQTSADALIEGDYHGAFTYFLNKGLAEGGGAISDEALLDRIKQGLKAGRYDQTPQLEKKALERIT